MRCPFKFGNYDFEGGTDCIGAECGFYGGVCDMDMSTSVQKRPNESCSQDSDQGERSETPDCENDSREMLEADVLKYYTHTTSTLMWPDDANIKTKWVSVSMDTVLEWLDRQEAITEAEQREWWGGVVAELQAEVDELTEDYKASSDGLEILTLKNAELQTQVNNLNSENAKLSSDELHLRQALASAEYDNATLREKLGRMLDNAHEITRIGGDC